MALRLIALLCLLLAASPAVSSEDAPPEPRVLHVFDFEERDDGNFEETPMHFARVVGHGLPHWVRGRLTTDAARSGRHSFRLDLNGGSAVYRLNAGVLPVRSGGRYRVAGHVRTSDLEHARARIIAYCVDREGRRLPETLRRTAPLVTPGQSPTWLAAEVTVDVHDDDAAWLVVELALLQPDAAAEGEPGTPDDVGRYLQDVRGTAWFDDVVVSRVPLLRVERPGNAGVFASGDAVALRLVANDADSQDLAAQGVVVGADGRVWWHGEARPLAATAAHERPFTFDVGTLPPGWYRLSMTVGRRDGADAAADTHAETAFVMLAPPLGDVRSPRDARLNLDAVGLAASAWDDLPALLGDLNAGRVEIALWGGPGDNDVVVDPEPLDRLAAGLRPLDVRIGGAFVGPGVELREASGGETRWAELLPYLNPAASDGVGDLWRASLGYLVSRHALSVDAWSVGTADDAHLFAGDARQRRGYDAFATVVRDLVADADLALAWPARRDRAALVGLRPASVALVVPSDVLPSQIGAYVADAPAGEAAALSLHLRSIDPATYGRLPALADFAERIVHGLATRTGRITLPLPFAGGSDRFEPTESYLVLHTLSRHLAGRRYAGTIDAGPDAVAMLFADDAGRGTLVLWNERLAFDAPPIDTTLGISLGDDAHQVDVWGNATPIEPSEAEARDGLATASIGRMPTVVTNVDAGLTRLRQSLRLDDPSIESSFRPHARRLLLTNTTPQTISGTLQVAAPGGWDVTLPDVRFSLQPGETLDRPIELRIPYNADAGEHRLDAYLRANLDGQPRRLRVAVPVAIGLRDIGLSTLARRDGSDLLVEQMIVNYGTEPANFTAFVLLPGFARQERLVLDLPAGESTRATFRIRGAAALPAGTAMRSGLRERGGERVLNDRMEL